MLMHSLTGEKQNKNKNKTHTAQHTTNLRVKKNILPIRLQHL